MKAANSLPKRNLKVERPPLMVAAPPQVDPELDSARKVILKSPVFWILLTFKLLLAASFTSYYLSDLFAPFVNYFVQSGFANPWDHFAAMGRLNSFPYPPLMLYLLAIPRLMLSPFISGEGTIGLLQLFSLRLPLLVADFAILYMLVNWFPDRAKKILWLYWASPIVLFISYAHGQLDGIPTSLFLGSVFFMRKGRFTVGMMCFALAMATKTHLLAALPFVLVYLYQERQLKGTLKALSAAVIVYAAMLGPYATGAAFQRMVFDTPERLRMLSVELHLESSSLLLAPLALILLLVQFLRYEKRNWDLFMLYLGIVFCVFLALSPPAPGYFYWSIPFLVYFSCRNTRAGSGLLYLLTASYFAYALFDSSFLGPQPSVWPGLVGDWMNGARGQIALFSGAALPAKLAFTTLEGSLLALVFSMFTFGVSSNSIYHTRTTPILIAVAGDSGTGKDYLINLVSKLLGTARTTVTSGDNYHRWPRGHSMWSVHTHLSLAANDLHTQHEHVISLSSSNEILAGTYDHSTGTFNQKQKVAPGKYVIFGGLHTLLLAHQRALFDLKVFIDPDENLRRYWKIRRDVVQRGYTLRQVNEAIQRRKNDRMKFVEPQRDHADLVVRFKALNKLKPDTDPQDVKLALDLIGANSFNWLALMEELGRVGTLRVSHEPYIDEKWQSLTVSGIVSSARLNQIVAKLIPNADELCDVPELHSDLEGCVQLVLLYCLSEKLRWSAGA